jgi:prefoldin beta subunit
MSGQQIPPWLQEQVMKLQQSQQNLQSISIQKQQLEYEQIETDKALEELNKVSDDNSVYKHAGSILIKSTKKELIDELEEKKELAKTRVTVLSKQETRLQESLKEQEAKLEQAIKGHTGGPTTSPPSTTASRGGTEGLDTSKNYTRS